ncbi:MAG: ribbon-helix-helix domain-containing protein [Planctomycetota bacterium]|nr:hypothetical protein [Planctomycetaceae bacterium]MDQ3332514.1 ribbon-helix-helix domain-containing protein [Planctomycetota bacterium]
MTTGSDNTGLGGSLLLKRTEQAEPKNAPDVRDVPNVANVRASEKPQESETAKAAQTPKRSERPRPPRREKAAQAVPRDRCTLYLDQDVNERLDIAARIEGRERSEVASDLLRRHLPTYRIERDA